jgi:uncharacterized protein YaaN involved in tellurite resistance
MTDSSLDLSTPATPTASAPGTAVVAAPAVQSDLVLTPPAAVPDIGPAQAISMMPVDSARAAELADKAKAFLAGTVALDPSSPAFIAKVNDVAALGQDDIRNAAAVSNEMLQRPVAALAAAKGAGDDGDAQRQVADTLVKLRLQIEDLDPSKAEGGIGHALLNLLPFRDQIRSYFAKYQSAQTQLNKIITSLQDGEDGLMKDNASIEGEKANLWATMQKLQEYSVLTGALDSQLVEQIATVRETDAAKADAITSDLLFTVRQKHQDLLTQLAVSAQGYLALDVVRKNNVELIKGVERATTTTVSALRTAVIVAQALANQKLVLDQITALNTTTSNLIVATAQDPVGGDLRAIQLGDDQHDGARHGLPEYLRHHERARHLQGAGRRDNGSNGDRAAAAHRRCAEVPRAREAGRPPAGRELVTCAAASLLSRFSPLSPSS